MPALVALTGVGKRIGTEGEKSYIQGESSNGSNTKISPAWPARQNSDAEEWINFSFKATLTGPGLLQRQIAAGMGLADA